jgi:hypothetical protein
MHSPLNKATRACCILSTQPRAYDTSPRATRKPQVLSKRPDLLQNDAHISPPAPQTPQYPGHTSITARCCTHTPHCKIGNIAINSIKKGAPHINPTQETGWVQHTVPATGVLHSTSNPQTYNKSATRPKACKPTGTMRIQNTEEVHTVAGDHHYCPVGFKPG